MNITDIELLNKKATELRKTIISMIVKAHASHIGSAFSALDIILFLYERVLRIDPKNNNDLSRDIFILSKGWAVSALYAVLSSKGFFAKELLIEYCTNGSKMIGTSTRNGIPGIEATTGSMGHGLPISVGMALASRRKGINNRIFVMISDGECDEGSTWEAALLAGHHKLDNLVVIVDHNKWQSFGRVEDILNLEPFSKKWEAFGWEVTEINGHDFSEMDKVFSKLPIQKNKPSVVIAHTIKGKGVSLLENKNEWHYKTPSEKELQVAEKELI